MNDIEEVEMSLLNHSWDLSPREAIVLQNQLRDQIVIEDRLGPINRVAGTDVGFEDNFAITRAAVAVLSFPELELIEYAIARRPTHYPYVPGLLSFREIPALLDALEKLDTTPDLLLCDGQGIAHPRRLGIATHQGLFTDIPSLGVGKNRLFGKHDEVPEGKGEWTPLLDKDEVIGAMLRTRIRVKPVIISPGHRIGIESAVQYAMACTTRYRLPETTRHAHKLASG